MEKAEQILNLPEHGTHCPSCGKFVGAYERCPYCQAEMKVYVGLKLVRRIAVAGAVIGVILLWVIAHFSEVPLITVGEIGVNHNMALVRVHGTVAAVRIDPDHNRFTLTLDDGTGRLNLSGFDKLQRFQQAMGDQFPKIGDEVEVRGNLNISDQWGVSMFLTTPNRVTLIARPQPVARALGAIAPADMRKLTVVNARVDRAEEHRSGLTVALSDGSGELALTLYNSDLENLPGPDARQHLTTPGNVLELTVLPVSYRGEMRLQLADASNPDYIKLISASETPVEPPQPVMLENVTQMAQGQIALIDVRVESARKIGKGGVGLTVSDSSGMAPLFLFSSELDLVPDGNLLMRKGTKLRARVKLSSYQGDLQLRIEAPGQAVVGEGDAP